MDIAYTILYLGFSILSYLNCRNSAVGMMNDIGINTRYYPKHYISLPKWMKKHFHIAQRQIPRFLYFELWLAIFFGCSGPVNTVVYISTGYDRNVIGIILLIHCCVIILNMVFFAVMSTVYKKSRKKVVQKNPRSDRWFL